VSDKLNRRNVSLKDNNEPTLQLRDISRNHYSGKVEKAPDFKNLKRPAPSFPMRSNYENAPKMLYQGTRE
jgi:hypothetical protein